MTTLPYIRTSSAVCLLALLAASNLGCNSSGSGAGPSRTIRVGKPTGDLNDPLWYVEVRPTRGSEASARGVRLLAKHLYDEALVEFNNAIEMNPDDHNSLFLAGVASEGLRESFKARDYYERAMAISDEKAYRRALEHLDEHP